MRKFILLFMLLAFVTVAGAQVTQMYTVPSGSATTAWTEIKKDSYRKINTFEITNDETSGSAELYVAFSTSTTNDTSSTRRFPLKWGEVLTLSGISVDRVFVRASTGTIAYRARYH